MGLRHRQLKEIKQPCPIYLHVISLVARCTHLGRLEGRDVGLGHPDDRLEVRVDHLMMATVGEVIRAVVLERILYLLHDDSHQRDDATLSDLPTYHLFGCARTGDDDSHHHTATLRGGCQSEVIAAIAVLRGGGPVPPQPPEGIRASVGR